MPRPGEGLRPVLFNSGLAGAVSLPHRTHFLVLLFLTYVKLSMNSFLPPFRNIPAGVLPESECKGRHFYGYHQTSAHFFYIKKHFFRQKRGGTLIISCAHARRAKDAENGARDARTGGAVRRRTLRKAREYLPQSTRVLPAKYCDGFRKVPQRDAVGITGHCGERKWQNGIAGKECKQ